MSETEMLQHLVELARASTGATIAELVILDEPEFPARLTTDPSDRVACSVVQRSALEASSEMLFDATGSAIVEPWVGSAAIVAITGPSGGAGWVAVGHPERLQISSGAMGVLEHVAGLVEDRLDRTTETKRMADLAETLRVNQQDLQTVRDQLSVSNSELEQFAYIAAHELVAPLRAVALYAEVLQTLVPGDESDVGTQTKQCASEIRSGVALMDQQIRYLLQLSTMERDTSSPQPVELQTIVQAAADSLDEQLSEVGASVSIGQLPVVAGRDIPLQSVFANLLSNAVRYRSNERPLRIDVGVKPLPNGWRVYVSDNGLGVSVEDQARIFKLFERAAGTTPGSGIGLAVSRRIVESFGGTIGVEPGDQHGSTFWVDLQSAEAPTTAFDSLKQAVSH